MRNPTYEGGYWLEPAPNKCVSMCFEPAAGNLPHVTLSAGVKTIAYSRDGLRLKPHGVVAIEISCEGETASFDLPASYARSLAKSLLEYATAVYASPL